MKNKFNIEDLFETMPRCNRPISKIHNPTGIQNKLLASTKINFQPRYERVLTRIIDTKPYKVLDAPGMLDDYYLNLLDWNVNDVISIGLSESVYVNNNSSKSVDEIYNSPNFVSSVRSNNNIIAIGVWDGSVVFYDLGKGSVAVRRKFHETRVSSLSWNGNVISSGDKTGRIVNFDVRSNSYDVLIGHTQEVCGLSWSCDNKYLASGGNDNDIRIWQIGHTNSRLLREHKSAVKALAWCPWKTATLASGGGTKDKSIKFWDVLECRLEKSVETESQICTLNYLPKYKELISSHGYTENDIILWKASNMKKIISFGKHDNRVLHVALSQDNTTLASVSGDENLKFWKITGKEKKDVKRESIGFR